jgi:SAM-dependent methyltransferase
MNAPFSANSFDVITAFDVLEHVRNPGEFLERVLHWLRPGGIFFARVPNIESWEARVFGTFWYGLELPRHLYHFSPRSIKHLIAEAGAPESYVTASRFGDHVGHSVRYVFQAILVWLGFSPVPMANPRRANLAWRIVRKAFWLSLVAPLSLIASYANAGVVIEVIVKKEDQKPWKQYPS